jgi:hypothetical protein
MTIGHILLSAVLFAIPVLLKYYLAFETRSLVENLRSQEEEVRRLSAQWQALERESLIMRRAVKQVATQKRHAATRRERLEDMQRRIASDYQPYLDESAEHTTTGFGEEGYGMADAEQSTPAVAAS